MRLLPVLLTCPETSGKDYVAETMGPLVTEIALGQQMCFEISPNVGTTYGGFTFFVAPFARMRPKFITDFQHSVRKSYDRP